MSELELLQRAGLAAAIGFLSGICGLRLGLGLSAMALLAFGAGAAAYFSA
jgi:hypothetical protein